MSDNCDASALKERLKRDLRQIADKLEYTLEMIDDENRCLLSDFEGIRKDFRRVGTLAASFYLQCYLSSFTDNYLDLAVSIQHLSERRHGALIVIERNDRLDAYIHSGIPVEAKLTYSLLESIFYTGNPLHDGAVLVRQDRIVSAANVLPLSEASVRDKKIGTRHRAAIGLTEQTDSVVLVVSEESGGASFAYKGTLHPMDTGSHLL